MIPLDERDIPMLGRTRLDLLRHGRGVVRVPPNSANVPMTAGRPSEFTEDIAATICELLMDGLSMRQICLRDDMPHRSTVERWIERNPEFAAKRARAREWQADIMDDLILETANKCTPETAAADRVKIGAFQWRAGRLAPKVYGEKITNEHTGPGGGPVQSVSVVTRDPVEAAKIYAKFMSGE